MRKLFFIITLLLTLVSYDSRGQRKLKEMDSDKQAQKDEMADEGKEPWTDKISYGGNIGATFGTGFSSVLLQPLAFYSITEKTMAGAGFTYIYWSQKYTYAGKTETFSDNVYGLNLFARQVLFDPLFIHAEYNPLNFTFFNYQTLQEERIWQNAFYLGGGLQQRFNDRGGYYIMLLYDVMWDANRSFYPTPYDIRMGFYF